MALLRRPWDVHSNPHPLFHRESTSMTYTFHEIADIIEANWKAL
jgi:hypothetical protein